MLYTLVTISLIIISALIFLPKFKSLTEHYSLGINFFLTLIATLVGVLLAISITNYEADKKEQQDVVKLLKASITSVETCYNYTEILIEYYQELPKNDQSRTEFYIKNPPPYPGYLDIFLTQNIVSKNLSAATLSELNELIINLKRAQNKDASLYLALLKQTLTLLNIENSFQKQEINKLQLEQKLDNI